MMKIFSALVMATCLLAAGCDTYLVVNDTYYTMDQLKETEKFQGYSVLEAPEIEGPYRLTREVNSTIYGCGQAPFHYEVNANNQTYEFIHEEEVVHYGFRFLSVRNKENEFAIILLKTLEKVETDQEKAAKKFGNRPGGNGRQRRPSPLTVESVLERLKRADADGDGLVALEDVPERLREMAENNDADGDGSLNEAEQTSQSIRSVGDHVGPTFL